MEGFFNMFLESSFGACCASIEYKIAAAEKMMEMLEDQLEELQIEQLVEEDEN